MKYKGYHIYYDKFEDVYYVEVDGKRLWSSMCLYYVQKYIQDNLK